MWWLPTMLILQPTKRLQLQFEEHCLRKCVSPFGKNRKSLAVFMLLCWKIFQKTIHY